MNEELQKAYDEVDRMLQPGKAFRTYPGKSMSEKMHVRARVDGDQVVTRRMRESPYRLSLQQLHWEIESLDRQIDILKRQRFCLDQELKGKLIRVPRWLRWYRYLADCCPLCGAHLNISTDETSCPVDSRHYYVVHAVPYELTED